MHMIFQGSKAAPTLGGTEVTATFKAHHSPSLHIIPSWGEDRDSADTNCPGNPTGWDEHPFPPASGMYWMVS